MMSPSQMGKVNDAISYTPKIYTKTPYKGISKFKIMTPYNVSGIFGL